MHVFSFHNLHFISFIGSSQRERKRVPELGQEVRYGLKEDLHHNRLLNEMTQKRLESM